MQKMVFTVRLPRFRVPFWILFGPFAVYDAALESAPERAGWRRHKLRSRPRASQKPSPRLLVAPPGSPLARKSGLAGCLINR